MSNYPSSIDDDSTLPAVNDNITQIGGEAINALRDAVIQMQLALGINIAGTTPSLADRLGVFINPDGTPNTSVLTSLGLVTLPITNNQIADNAGIPESKLKLDFRTQDLFNYIRDLSSDINVALGWISVSGVKLEPHLAGSIYRHTLSQIDVTSNVGQFLLNNLRVPRDNSQSYNLVNDINNELLAHQWADGSPFGTINNITTNNGSTYPNNYGHTASGIFLNTSRFNNVPQTSDDLQLFAEYVDSSSILLLGTRIQNLYTNGISTISQSSNLTADGYGQFIIPPTPAIAYLKFSGNVPFDDINHGDDIIQFAPSATNQNSNYFDSLFSLVKPGDIIRINYGDGYNIEVPYVIREKKYNPASGSKTYIVRIAGKNQFSSANAIARVDRSLSNNNKYGELAISPVNGINGQSPSLVINNPRGAQALGLGFDSDQFDETHYLLYLALYPTGFATDGYVILPAIDVTGNKGTTPGLYTLDSIVQSTNNAFRAPGFNYRFTAFEYQGEFGICLSDSYNNAAFSVISVAIAPNGSIDTASTGINFPNNIIDLQPAVGNVGPDPLGFGPAGAGVASPPFMLTYGSAAASQYPTQLFIPLKRNNYYVDGSESERLAIEPTQVLDTYGDGYWVATVQSVQLLASTVQTRYRIPLDLSASNLKVGKTIVVQSIGNGGTLVDFGRFIISSINFGCSPNIYTDIIVYDAVHAAGFSPTSTTIQPFSQVGIYFCADSVSFSTESATDLTTPSPSAQFKRYFEVYVDSNGTTYTQERSRISLNNSTVTINYGTSSAVPLYASSSLNSFDIVTVSPKLRGYQFGAVNKITMNMISYSSTTGIFDGYLASYNGSNFTNIGPLTQGKKGEIVRFYDETNTDYIDISLDIGATTTSFSNQIMDFQLFPSLQLDSDIMLLSTCQVNDNTQIVNKIVDRRQFGNTSEKDLSTSVFDILSAPEKYLHSNGIIRGFDIFNIYSGSEGIIQLSGGVVLVNGKIIDINNKSVSIPIVRESYSSMFWNVDWALCINDEGEYITIPLLDFDSSINNPNVSSRTFTASDFVSSTTYQLPAILFSDLISRRTDLTILYIVSSVITGTPSAPVITLTSQDARKFVYKKDQLEIPSLIIGSQVGDFRSFGALNSWLTFNSTYTNVVDIIGGTFTSFPPTLSYSNIVTFNGNSNVTFSPNASLDINELKINNIQFSYSSDLTISNSVLNNCTFNSTGATTVFISSTFNNAVINMSTSSNCSFDNCIFNNCTFNFNGSGIIFSVFGSSAVVNNSIFNFNATPSSVSLANTIVGNTFVWNVTPVLISIIGNINIYNNNFSASGSSFSGFISIEDGYNGNVFNNYFYRNGITITGGYIVAPPSHTSGVVAITNNFFDSPTIDGTNQRLVSNLPLVWIYYNNINGPLRLSYTGLITGTSYAVLPTDEILMIRLSSAFSITLPPLADTTSGRILTIKDFVGSAGTNNITINPGGSFDNIEGTSSPYVINNNHGSVTFVAVIGSVPNQSGWSIISKV